MQLAEQLKAVGIGTFPCAVNYDYAKQKWAKHPLTVDREAWALTAQRPTDDPAVQWNGCKVLGLPVPAGVMVIDLDTYVPGCSTDSADALFGARLPWGEALIQTTIGGGSHYAFRLPAWPVRQGAAIGGKGSGIDTRVAGLGFICSGEGYTPANAFGVMRLAYPESLPVLPDACRPLLEQHVAEKPERAELPDNTDRDIATVQAALRHIDPTERDDWRNVGYALKHYFHDDEETGFSLWDAWSSGEYWPDGCPTGYTPETQRSQWSGFKAIREGATITVGTMFHMAMRAGWQPPARFDTASAFGAGAVPVETFTALIDRIMEEGGDSRKTEELLNAIATAGCNEVQALLLRNELKAMMRSSKILDKDLAAAIDRKTTPVSAMPTAGLYAGNDTENAELFLVQNYPGRALIRCDSEFFRYTGKCWERVTIEALEHQVAMAMMPARSQHNRISSCISMVVKSCPVYSGGMQQNLPHRIIFDNGVLDTNTGVLGPHSMEYLTTNILPYNYAPGSPCGAWLQFLHNTLDGDLERISLLQEWIGYLLTADYRHHKILLMLGPKRCGKGTIGRVIQQIVGEVNFSGGSLTSFATDSFLDSLRTKPVLFIGDAEKRLTPAKVNQVIERIKSISGNDSVAFDRKFLSGLSETLPTRITIAANSVPNLFDDSGALASRLLVLPFNRSFYGNEDLYLFDKLYVELPGIAMWALEGLQRLRSNGRFTLSTAGHAETQYICASFSPLSRFVTEFCDVGPECECKSVELHTAYRAWCLEEGEDILKRKTFVGAVKDATRGHSVRYDTHRYRDGSRGWGFKGLQPRDPVQMSTTASAFQPVVVK